MKIISAIALAMTASFAAALGASAPPPATGAGATPAPAAAGEAAAPDEGPTAVFTGRVLLKDGVTPVAGARLQLSGPEEADQRVVRTNRRGRFRVRLPAGQYLLTIARENDLYRAPSSYRISPGVRNEIDFLLLRDYEKPKGSGPEPFSTARGPDPRPAAPVQVGTVVDVVHPAGGGWLRRRVGLLGFIGSLIALAIAAG